MNQSIKLTSKRSIGPHHPSYIIAEIGSNHDGDINRAKKLISLAKESGADATKFQSFQAPLLVNPLTKNQDTWEKNPAWDVLEKLTLPELWHEELQKHAQKEGIDFLSTPFDLERLALLDDLNVPAIKIASGDLTNLELLKATAALKKPIFLSTGAANLEEVKQALSVLTLSGANDVVLLQCTSVYPPSYTDTNIHALTTLQKTFNVPTGYSDHTPDDTVVLAAIALGACLIEKHFTDDKSRPGPDHHFALDPTQFKNMVKNIRNLEKALGDGIKKPSKNEESERIFARRAIYSQTHIKKDTKLTRDHVKFVRPLYPEGIPSSQWPEIDGKSSAKDIAINQLLTWDMIK